MSLSARRAWIEIHYPFQRAHSGGGRSPQGERGLKSVVSSVGGQIIPCRSPQGERGLKSNPKSNRNHPEASLSARRAWIEIIRRITPANSCPRRSPQGERGLKSYGGSVSTISTLSLSARRAWIEILGPSAPLTGAVCRSPQGERGLKLCHPIAQKLVPPVALRKESVD